MNNRGHFINPIILQGGAKSFNGEYIADLCGRTRTCNEKATRLEARLVGEGSMGANDQDTNKKSCQGLCIRTYVTKLKAWKCDCIK